MSVPTTPKMSEIQTEFGGSNPIGLSEYYAGGPLVPSASPAPNGPIPGSGEISMGEFRGATKASFISASGGNATLTDGDYKIHVFTGSGTFTVNAAGVGGADNTNVDYLVQAGGGGGGNEYGGGGGAGGTRASDQLYSGPGSAVSTGITVPAQGYPVTIGGGAGASNGAGSRGSNSSAFPITSAGGGGGGNRNSGSATTGGSGGGGVMNHGGQSPSGAAGNTPSASPVSYTHLTLPTTPYV